MARRTKPINRSPYPQYAIEAIARSLWPDIQTYFESEEGQKEFAAWKAQQVAEQDILQKAA